ncbi:monomethylamine:corrinoid methyltransferase [Methanococcoides sp. SA1]|nr:monomethylamine:corrinoid methyltransferase [Methanococcoides sp. SA1]
MYQIVDQMLNGKKIEEREHERLLYETNLYLVEKYDIHFDKEEMVPSDQNMADRVFEAAIDLMEEVGVYSIDTGRVIELTREEIVSGIRNTKEPYDIGEGLDAKTIVFREVAEDSIPIIIGGPCGAPVSIESYIQIHRSYAKLNAINALAPASIYETSGSTYYKTPLNLHSAYTSTNYVKEASALEGRSGMCATTPPCIEDIRAALSIANPTFTKKGDIHEIYQQLDMKTDFNSITKAIHYRATGILYLCDQGLLLGGKTVTSAEQLAIQIVAEGLKSKLIHQGHMYTKEPDLLQTGVASSHATLWASFIASMAITRNSRYIHGTDISNSAGPCSEMMMYETATQTIGNVVCGSDILAGPISNGAHVLDHSTGLDSLFMAEIAKLAANLSIADANYLCKEIYTKYKDKMHKPDHGKSFEECYNLNTIEPTSEFLQMYDNVMSEIYEIIK